jgi:hypothetical protein
MGSVTGDREQPRDGDPVGACAESGRRWREHLPLCGIIPGAKGAVGDKTDDDRVEAEMKVYIWCDGAPMPNGGPAGARYVVVGGVHLLGSQALGDATNNVAEYTAVRNALRAAADAGATSAHVRMDSPVVFGHLSLGHRVRAEHLIQLRRRSTRRSPGIRAGSGSPGFPGSGTELPTSSRRTARGPRRR